MCEDASLGRDRTDGKGHHVTRDRMRLYHRTSNDAVMDRVISSFMRQLGPGHVKGEKVGTFMMKHRPESQANEHPRIIKRVREIPDKHAYLKVITEGSTVNSRSRMSVKRNILILKIKGISMHIFFLVS